MRFFAFIISVASVAAGIIWYPDPKAQTDSPDSAYPAAAARLDFEKVVNPYTGKIPAGAPYKALRQLVERGLLAWKPFASFKTGPYGWTPVNDFFSTLAVSKITYDPNDLQVYYFCTGEGWWNADAVQGAGVWKSTDAGVTWFQLPATDTSLFYRCQDIGVHHLTGDVYVATRGESFGSSEGGLYRSQDGGTSWERVLGAGAGSLKSSFCDIEFTASGGIFTSSGIFETDGIYFSETGDSGTWTRLTNGFPTSGINRIEIAAAPSNDSVAYTVAQGTDDSIAGLWKTVNRGTTWTQLPNPGGNRNLARRQGWYDLIIAVDPNNENVVAAGGLCIWRSQDGGMTWTQLTHHKEDSSAAIEYMHVDQHEIVFVNSDTVYFGHDGGIWRTDNFTAPIPHFYNRNTSYNCTQFYACAINAGAGNYEIIGGTQDNGSSISSGPGISSFNKLTGADGSYCAISHLDGNIMYTSKQYERMYRFTAGGDGPYDTITNPYIGKNEASGTLFINPLEMDPADPEKLYMATNKGLWRFYNASTSKDTAWAKCTRSWGTISAIGIAADVPNLVFIGRRSGIGNIYRVVDADSTDASYNPENADPGDMLPRVMSGTIYCSSIYVYPEDANHVAVTYSNYGVKSVWKSNNALDPAPDWISVEGDLPDIPVRWAILHPDNPAVCYIATEIGVFYSNLLEGDSTKWLPLPEGLANVRVDMLEVRKSDKVVVAATHGRGLFTGKILPDNRITWEERGPKNVGGRTRTIMVDPNDPTGRTIWSGSVSGGLWKTNNIDSVEVVPPVPTEAPPAELLLTIFPNPFGKSGISLRTAVPEAGEVEFMFYDLKGSLVKKIEKNLTAGYHDLSWDPSRNLEDGLYLIQVSAGGKTAMAKAVLQRD